MKAADFENLKNIAEKERGTTVNLIPLMTTLPRAPQTRNQRCYLRAAGTSHFFKSFKQGCGSGPGFCPDFMTLWIWIHGKVQ
jgi:hypothetical protein